MKMIVLCQSDFVSQFTDRYVIEELGNIQPDSLKKTWTYTQFLHEVKDNTYAFCVIEIGVLLKQCRPVQILDLFSLLKGRHVTALGRAAEFFMLPKSAVDCISTFYNTGATMNEDAPLYADTIKAKQGLQQADPYRAMLRQIGRGRQYGAVEMQRLGTHLNLWDSDSCVFVVCLDLSGSDVSILDQITSEWLEQQHWEPFPGPQCVYFVQKSNTTFFGIVVFRAKGAAKQINYANMYTSGLYTSVRRNCPALLNLTIGISSLQCSQMNLPRQFEEAADAAFRRVYDGSGRIYHAQQNQSLPDFNKNDYMKNLRDAIDSRNKTEVFQSLDNLFGKIIEYKLPEHRLSGILMEVMSMMYMLCVEENLNIAEFNDNTQDSIDFLFLQNIVSIKQEHRSFTEHFSRILDLAARNRDAFSAYSLKIRRGIQYILENYQKNIQLRDIAAAAGVSPNYLCSIFKKETGFTVVEYLNAVRIEHAKELLRTTNMPAADISSLTGFSDTAYFSSVFKRITCQTITDFRKQQKQDKPTVTSGT